MVRLYNKMLECGLLVGYVFLICHLTGLSADSIMRCLMDDMISPIEMCLALIVILIAFVMMVVSGLAIAASAYYLLKMK